MSYCRWSSMDFQCDVYCYEHVGDFVAVCIAKRRHDIEGIELPEPVDIRKDGSKPWLARYKAVREILETCELKEIGLEHDGKSFSFDTLDEAADFLEELKDLGYIMPDSAIRQMRECAKEDEE